MRDLLGEKAARYVEHRIACRHGSGPKQHLQGLFLAAPGQVGKGDCLPRELIQNAVSISGFLAGGHLSPSHAERPGATSCGRDA